MIARFLDPSSLRSVGITVKGGRSGGMTVKGGAIVRWRLERLGWIELCHVERSERSVFRSLVAALCQDDSERWPLRRDDSERLRSIRMTVIGSGETKAGAIAGWMIGTSGMIKTLSCRAKREICFEIPRRCALSG